MPGTLYGYPFDEELFVYHWENEPDPVKTAFIESGVLQVNGEIQAQIANGGHYYTIPFYKTIGGEEQNYDGATDITATETEGASQTGIVYGRMAAWKARDFVIDHNSGANPWVQIASQLGKWRAKKRQARAIGIAEAALATTNVRETAWATELAKHVTDISSSDTTIADSNKLSATTLGDAVVDACGDNAQGLFNLAIMHSKVARNLRDLDLLEFRKYTDPNGIQRQLPIADMDGMTVIVDDACVSGEKYNTYLLGAGFLQFAEAPVEHPAEYDRDPYTNGGQESLIIRYREAMQPNGFSFTNATIAASPTDDELGTAANYTAIFDPKSIGAVKVVSNG